MLYKVSHDRRILVISTRAIAINCILQVNAIKNSNIQTREEVEAKGNYECKHLLGEQFIILLIYYLLFKKLLTLSSPQ